MSFLTMRLNLSDRRSSQTPGTNRAMTRKSASNELRTTLMSRRLPLIQMSGRTFLRTALETSLSQRGSSNCREEVCKILRVHRGLRRCR